MYNNPSTPYKQSVSGSSDDDSEMDKYRIFG
jgi:hypothetical protein